MHFSLKQGRLKLRINETKRFFFVSQWHSLWSLQNNSTVLSRGKFFTTWFIGALITENIFKSTDSFFSDLLTLTDDLTATDLCGLQVLSSATSYRRTGNMLLILAKINPAKAKHLQYAPRRRSSKVDVKEIGHLYNLHCVYNKLMSCLHTTGCFLQSTLGYDLLLTHLITNGKQDKVWSVLLVRW